MKPASAALAYTTTLARRTPADIAALDGREHMHVEAMGGYVHTLNGRTLEVGNVEVREVGRVEAQGEIPDTVQGQDAVASAIHLERGWGRPDLSKRVHEVLSHNADLCRGVVEQWD